MILAALALLSGSAQAAPRVLTVAGYWHKLNDTRALAVGLEGQPPAAARPQLLAAAAEWAASGSVTLANGAALPLDNSYLIAQLRADPAEPAQVADLALAMATEGAAWPPPRHTVRDLDSLSTILAQPEFQWAPAQPTWLDQLRDRLWSALLRFLARLLSGTGLAGGGELLGQALAWLAALAVVGVLAYALRGLFLNFAPEVNLPLEDGSPGDEGLTADAASRRAQALSSGGDYRTAVRYLYLASLLHLEEAGLLRYDRSLTNREVLRSVAGRPELAARLQGVVEVFDRVWYGFDALDSAAYADYSARVADLREQK